MKQLADAAKKTGSDPGGQIKAVFNKIAEGVGNLINLYDRTLKSDETTAKLAQAFRECTDILRQQIPNADASNRLDIEVAMQFLKTETAQYGPISMHGPRQPIPEAA